MNKVLGVLLSLLACPLVALAQVQGDALSLGKGASAHLCRVNENGTDIAADEADGNYVACDTAGRVYIINSDPTSGLSQSVIPVSGATGFNGTANTPLGYQVFGSDAIEAASTTTVLNFTAHTMRKGDVLHYRAGGTAANVGTNIPVCSTATNTVTLCYPLPATPGTDTVDVLRPTPLRALGSDSGGGNWALAVNIDSNTNTSNATSILKLEDAAAASGDALVGVAGYYSATPQTALAGEGDYGLPKFNLGGALFVDVNYNAQVSTANGLLKLEDVATAGNDAGVAPLVKLQTALSADAAANDWGTLKADLTGRLVTTQSVPEETWQSCGTATASTADVAIKAAVASNRIYVTNVTCSSSDADNATNINFKDGSTVIAVGGVNQMATTSAGTFTATFPVPLRGTSNTALNFNTAVLTSSVICCASGYISVN